MAFRIGQRATGSTAPVAASSVRYRLFRGCTGTSNAPHGLPLVTHQPLHSASFGTVVWSTPHVGLLSGWPWLAVPSLAFIVVLLVLAGHWAGGSLNDGLVTTAFRLIEQF
jgi:hypothetical protein